MSRQEKISQILDLNLWRKKMNGLPLLDIINTFSIKEPLKRELMNKEFKSKCIKIYRNNKKSKRLHYHMLKMKTLCITNKFLNNLEKWKNVKILKNQNTIENKWSKKLKEIISWMQEEIKEDRIKKSKKLLTDSSLPLSIMRQ